jgi:excisionase family DNA binding protein
MTNYTFEQLPFVLGKIEERLEKIEMILMEGNYIEPCGKDLLSVNEASELINLTVSTLYSKVSRREIPVFKKGKRLYFSYAELQEWIKSGKKKTNEELFQEVRTKSRIKTKF